MDHIDFSTVSRAPAPVHVPDQRPTADTAALVRNPRPDIPLPIAPTPSQGISQTGAVAKSLLLDEPASTTDPTLPLDKRLAELPRILKPYGLSMLPDPRKQERIDAATQRETAATKVADAARARENEATSDRRTADAAASVARAATEAESKAAPQTRPADTDAEAAPLPASAAPEQRAPATEMPTAPKPTR